MPITRSQIDPFFLKGYRLSVYFPLVGMDGATTDGTNADIGIFLTEGCQSIGLTPSTFGIVSDADLSGITDKQARQLVAVAQLAALRTVAVHPRFYDQAVSLGSKRFSQIRDGLNAAIKDLEALLAKLYGYGLGTLGGSTIQIGRSDRDHRHRAGGDFL